MSLMLSLLLAMNDAVVAILRDDEQKYFNMCYDDNAV